MGQVFRVEAFVGPHRTKVRVSDVEAAQRIVAGLDGKMQDVSIVLVSELPAEAVS